MSYHRSMGANVVSFDDKPLVITGSPNRMIIDEPLVITATRPSPSYAPPALDAGGEVSISTAPVYAAPAPAPSSTGKSLALLALAALAAVAFG